MDPELTPIEPFEFGSMVLSQLSYEPTSQQVQLVAALARFYCRVDDMSDPVFILAGYAGTGKTSMMGALVRAIRHINRQVVLLAPTGRAAKVLSQFAGMNAYTIHRFIYRMSATEGMVLGSNPLQHALFVVDEASMIGDDDTLLSNLIHYVYSGVGCRLLLLGDTAQLPPVGLPESPAMSPARLRGYGLKVTRALLTATVRQQSSSGVLHNATWLRYAMGKEPLPLPHLTVSPFDDVRVVEAEDLEDALNTAYRGEDGVRDSILITRSNRRATAYNLEIRNRILGREEMITRGELLMVAKNNYHWSKGVAHIPFIANGDIATVEQIYDSEEKYGLLFADAKINLTHRDTTIDCKLMLDTLTSDTASMSQERIVQLAQDVLAANSMGMSLSATAQRQILRTNPYYNALQVKYAYAVTCHKAQGGQWPNVFVDLGGIAPESQQGLDFYRWLYTAITRTTERLYLISPTLQVR